jgi:DNA-binding SARP family transcriptional activator
MDDTGQVIQRVTALQASSPDAERTLMDGYAVALSLEGERSRLERRFDQLARALAEDHDASRLPELRALKQRIASTDAELTRLREVLGAVRQRLLAAGVAIA